MGAKHSICLCPPPPRVDVVICLSTTVRNDTLQEAREQRVALKCRKQLRVEELEMVKTLLQSKVLDLMQCDHGKTLAAFTKQRNNGCA